MTQWEEERCWPRQMWAEAIDHKVAFVRRLPDKWKIKLLQIAQATVERFAGARRGSTGKILCFEQRDGQATAGGIQGCSRPRHSAADDNHVEDLPGHLADRLSTLLQS